jgi:hypothetical protein
VTKGEVDGESAGKTIGKLVSTVSGARGFLVSFLTGGSKLADEPPNYVIEALKSAPLVVCDLLAKNLVMSSTMAVTHRRNEDADNEQGSMSVQRRTTKLVQLMDTPEMAARLEEMRKSVVEGSGPYTDFLDRWHYDEEQLGCARRALGVAMGAKP